MNIIKFGDCREIMRKWAQEGVKAQTCVTSPPYYGLRDYGRDGQIGLEETPEEYITAMVEVFRCVRDVLADDGTVWLNIGDSYYNYRPGKGQALVKQSVANNDQDLPQNCARRGNKLDGLKEKDLIEVVKGGLIVDIGLRGFLPASLVEMRRVRDLSPYIGKTVEARIIELDKNRNNVVLSRRAYLEQTQSESRTTFLNQLQKGGRLPRRGS